MKKLHLVGFTTDLEALIFSTSQGSESGNYLVDIDGDLLDAIEEARQFQGRSGADSEVLDEQEVEEGEGEREEPPRAASRHSTAPRKDSLLSPREIQARLRAGMSVVEVAEIAEIGEAWVERFALPVLAEQNQVLNQAMGCTFSKPRLGPSALPLRASVMANLAFKGIFPSDRAFMEAWRVGHVDSSAWSLAFTFYHRRQVQTAVWEFDVSTGEFSARNPLASSLGYSDGRLPPRRDVTQLDHHDPDLVPPEALSKKRRPAAAGVQDQTHEEHETTPPRSVPRRRNLKAVPAVRVSVAKKASAPQARASRAVARPAPTKAATKKAAAARKAADLKKAAEHKKAMAA
ncbi:MAG: septation protein SepH, partial [Acidimicrobiales bacterium]